MRTKKYLIVIVLLLLTVGSSNLKKEEQHTRKEIPVIISCDDNNYFQDIYQSMIIEFNSKSEKYHIVADYAQNDIQAMLKVLYSDRYAATIMHGGQLDNLLNLELIKPLDSSIFKYVNMTDFADITAETSESIFKEGMLWSVPLIKGKNMMFTSNQNIERVQDIMNYESVFLINKHDIISEFLVSQFSVNGIATTDGINFVQLLQDKVTLEQIRIYDDSKQLITEMKSLADNQYLIIDTLRFSNDLDINIIKQNVNVIDLGLPPTGSHFYALKNIENEFLDEWIQYYGNTFIKNHHVYCSGCLPITKTQSRLNENADIIFSNNKTNHIGYFDSRYYHSKIYTIIQTNIIRTLNSNELVETSLIRMEEKINSLIEEEGL